MISLNHMIYRKNRMWIIEESKVNNIKTMMVN